MLNLNIAGASSTAAPSSGIKFNFAINRSAQNAEASATSPSAKLANLAAKNTSSAVDRKFDALYEENAYSDFEMIKYLGSQNEGEKDVFANYILSFAMNESGENKSLSEFDVEGIVNTIGAKYASLAYEIENGDYPNKDELLAELDKQYEKGVEELSKYYSESAGTLFNALGTQGEIKNLGSTLTDLINEQKDKYLEFVKSDEGKAYIKKAQDGDSENNLLKSDIALTKVLLTHEAEQRVAEEKDAEEKAKLEAINAAKQSVLGQSIEAKQVANDKGDGNEVKDAAPKTFTLADLQSLGKLQSTLSSFLTEDANVTEEEVGYQLGLTYAKAQEVMTQGGASSYLTSLFNDNFDNFVDNKVKSLNASLKEKQEKADELSNTSADAYKELSTSTILDIFNATKNVYETTGSADEAVISGYELANKSFQLNVQNNGSVQRYKNDTFFSSFYNTDKTNNAYDMGMSNYRRYTNIMHR